METKKTVRVPDCGANTSEFKIAPGSFKRKKLYKQDLVDDYKFECVDNLFSASSVANPDWIIFNASTF